MTGETKQVVIGGTAVTLERRVCEGDCGKDFHVLPSSTQRRARSNCDIVCTLGRTNSSYFGHQSRPPKAKGLVVPLSAEQNSMYHEVIAELESRAERGVKVSLQWLLPTLGYKVSDWNYMLIRLRDLRLTEMHSRYKDVMRRVRVTRKGATVDTGQKIMDSLTSPESVKAALDEHLGKRRPAPKPDVVMLAGSGGLHKETMALLKVLEDLRPLDQPARNRVLTAAKTMLEAS